jgi:prepilin-type N-terminal cleavage/methylation domain-containing protein/prepilin-type processing-associated H-X9-DG protein
MPNCAHAARPHSSFIIHRSSFAAFALPSCARVPIRCARVSRPRTRLDRRSPEANSARTLGDLRSAKWRGRETHATTNRWRGHGTHATTNRSPAAWPHSSFIIQHSSFAAFTLLELLVVIAIIGVLVALLLPAVQAAREASRRTAFQNNLHQIGLALHGYHNAHAEFPRGGWPTDSPNLSWTAAILPFIEQQTLFEQIHREVPYYDAGNLAAGQNVLPVFLCPTAPNDSRLRKSPDPLAAGKEYARTNYGAINGERTLRTPTATNSPERGAMIFESNISIKQITDGTSHTALIAEAPEGVNGFWLSVRNLFEQAKPINTPAAFAPQYVFYDYGQEINSYHPGGAIATFADGSARFLNESIDNQTLAAICSRAGGEPTPNF